MLCSCAFKEHGLAEQDVEVPGDSLKAISEYEKHSESSLTQVKDNTNAEVNEFVSLPSPFYTWKSLHLAH